MAVPALVSRIISWLHTFGGRVAPRSAWIYYAGDRVVISIECHFLIDWINKGCQMLQSASVFSILESKLVILGLELKEAVTLAK
jgi:hypothetical protein